MRLLLHGFGTSVRVNSRTLEIDWRAAMQVVNFLPQVFRASISRTIRAENGEWGRLIVGWRCV
jgi:hypothetical protein